MGNSYRKSSESSIEPSMEDEEGSPRAQNLEKLVEQMNNLWKMTLQKELTYPELEDELHILEAMAQSLSLGPEFALHDQTLRTFYALQSHGMS